jgi:hypothetical protein
VSASSGYSLGEKSCAISTSILALNAPVLLMNIGTIMTSALMVPWVCRACLCGS